MCIIIAKNKNDRLPTKKELEYCFKGNPDGAGFMYVKHNKVHIDKGYMTLEAFMTRYKELCEEFDNFKHKALVIHCRIGTAGTNSAMNTHPYPLTNKVWKLHQTKSIADVGVAHNGIIRDYNPVEGDGDVNDTQNFIRLYMWNKYKQDKDFFKRRFEQDAMDKITNSRLAILDKNENIYKIGYWVTEKGLAFSNNNYKPFEYTKVNYTKYSTNGFSDYYNRIYGYGREI